MRRELFIIGLGLLATACGTTGNDKSNGGGSDTGDNLGGTEPGDAGGCELVEETPLELDGTTPDGSPVIDMVNIMTGSHAATLTWADETTTEIVVEVTDINNARFLDYEVDTDGPHGSIELACNDLLSIDASITVTTSDGQLNKTVTSTLTQSEGSHTPVLAIDLTDGLGTFNPSDWSEESHGSTWAELTASWTENGIDGTIDGYGEDEYGEMVTITRFDIAAFLPEGLF